MGGKKCCSTCCQIITFAILAILFIGLGIGAIFLFKKLIDDNVNDQVALKNGTQSMDEWKSPTSPIYMHYYVFDCVNPKDVENNMKPNLTQKGPYTYLEKRLNTPIEWSDDGNVLTYESTKWYIFDPERSCANCSENDTVTAINIAPMSLVNATVDSPYLVQMGLKLVFDLTGVTLYKTRTVKEILFGYTDELLSTFRKFESFLPKAIVDKLGAINPNITLQYNGTSGAVNTGNVSIVTGKDDPKHVMNTLAWRGKNSSDFWKTKYGGMLNGTDGTHFHPFVKKDDVLYTFITDLCRSLYLDYVNEVSVKDIDLLRFTTTAGLFANASVNKDNAAFCVPRCFASGVLPIGQCLPSNPPIMMSAPHFFQGDQELIDNITGMHPSREKHATYIDVEPYTGITMRAFKRLQVNLYVARSNHIDIAKNVRTMIHPILFLEESAEVSTDDANKFKSMVYDKLTMTKGVQYGLIAIGGLFVIVLLVVAIRGWSKRDDEEKVGLISE